MDVTGLSNNRYKCSENGCNASFSKPFKLEIHKRKHTGERPFICDVEDCNKAYTNIAHLKRHKCFVHDKTSEIMCTVDGCGRVFNNVYSLRKHLHIHEYTDNVFKCAHCSEVFKKKRQLKQHLYSHTEEGLKCSICNISFGSLHQYNKHKRNHKTYTCDCGSIFVKWTLFCEHRKSACSVEKIDHKCIICNKVFTTKTNLKTHSLSHLEESQRDIFRCPYLNCKRSYKFKKNLTSHIAVFHEKVNDDIKINCTEEGCDMVFKSKKNLRQHVLNIHNAPPKKKKDRRPRKDKGKRKKCMASILSGVPLPIREHLAIIKNSNLPLSDVCKDSKKLPTDISKKAVDNETVVAGDKEVVPRRNNISDLEIEDSDNSPRPAKQFLSEEEQLKEKFTTILKKETPNYNFINITNVGDILILEDTRHCL